MSRCGCQSVGMGMLWCKKHSPEGQRDIIKDLEAENQRLREALLELENYIDAYYVSVYHDIVNEAHKHSNDNSVLLEDK